MQSEPQTQAAEQRLLKSETSASLGESSPEHHLPLSDKLTQQRSANTDNPAKWA